MAYCGSLCGVAMIRYSNKKSNIRCVDILDQPESLRAYIHIKNPNEIDEIKAKLSGLGFAILSQTTVGTESVIAANGPRIEPKLIHALTDPDNPLKIEHKRKPFDAWKVRSILGFGGQILQLAASILKNKVDGPLLIFASTNLAANTVNLVYRGQKRDDPHQLQLLKTNINALVEPQITETNHLPDVHDNRSLLREHVRDNTPNPVHHFMERYSVNVGELGLRYVGALGMAYPASDWGKAMSEGRMPMMNKAAPLRAFTGLTSIFGKTLATTSKVPDPYNPEPKSKLTEWREKYSFLAGGIIEAGAFSALTYDAIANSAPVMKDGVLDTSRSLKFGKNYYRDWLSGLGGALFVTGYIVRSWAKYGERKVDMHEVYAHASDAIALLPPEKTQQGLADVSAYLASHFKGKNDLTFGDIYNNISDDLCREHHITMLPPTNVPVQAVTVPIIEQPASHIPATTVQAGQTQHATLQPETQTQLAV